MVRGAVICGALEQKFVEDNGYRIEEINLKTVSLGYQTVKGDYFFGENEKMYPQRKVIFPMGTKLSSE